MQTKISANLKTRVASLKAYATGLVKAPSLAFARVA